MELGGRRIPVYILVVLCVSTFADCQIHSYVTNNRDVVECYNCSPYYAAYAFPACLYKARTCDPGQTCSIMYNRDNQPTPVIGCTDQCYQSDTTTNDCSYGGGQLNTGACYVCCKDSNCVIDLTTKLSKDYFDSSKLFCPSECSSSDLNTCMASGVVCTSTEYCEIEYDNDHDRIRGRCRDVTSLSQCRNNLTTDRCPFKPKEALSYFQTNTWDKLSCYWECCQTNACVLDLFHHYPAYNFGALDSYRPTAASMTTTKPLTKSSSSTVTPTGGYFSTTGTQTNTHYTQNLPGSTTGTVDTLAASYTSGTNKMSTTDFQSPSAVAASTTGTQYFSTSHPNFPTPTEKSSTSGSMPTDLLSTLISTPLPVPTDTTSQVPLVTTTPKPQATSFSTTLIPNSIPPATQNTPSAIPWTTDMSTTTQATSGKSSIFTTQYSTNASHTTTSFVNSTTASKFHVSEKVMEQLLTNCSDKLEDLTCTFLKDMENICRFNMMIPLCPDTCGVCQAIKYTNCHDTVIDNGCDDLVNQTPSICDDPLSIYTCPKSCGQCAKVAEAIVNEVLEKNNMATQPSSNAPNNTATMVNPSESTTAPELDCDSLKNIACDYNLCTATNVKNLCPLICSSCSNN